MTRRVAAKILSTDDVAEIKALGRLVAHYSERYWNGIRQIVVFTGLLAKFTQNDDLKRSLPPPKVPFWLNVRSGIPFGHRLVDEGPGQAGYWQVEGAKPAGYALMMVRERL